MQQALRAPSATSAAAGPGLAQKALPARRGRGREAMLLAPPVAAATASQVRTEQGHLDPLSNAYSRQMKDAMGWKDRVFDYDYSRGLYYHEITRGLFCGSQPRHAGDIQELKEDLQLTAILSLQQDKDMQYWGVNPDQIRRRCSELGIQHLRRPVKDFDPHSLRKVLPSAAQALHQALANGGRVYVHCTAGLGRAPGLLIAYLHWFHPGLSLPQAYQLVTSIRPCGPKREAVRGATFDLLSGQPMEAFARVPEDAYTQLQAEDQHALQWRILRQR
ncbi:hypothetical protein QJQ45_003781 [Haematococcus lacustris]|nr:hypothetical protein QJQ45_003781 [Haematococcus lacustris]